MAVKKQTKEVKVIKKKDIRQKVIVTEGGSIFKEYTPLKTIDSAIVENQAAADAKIAEFKEKYKDRVALSVYSFSI